MYGILLSLLGFSVCLMKVFEGILIEGCYPSHVGFIHPHLFVKHAANRQSTIGQADRTSLGMGGMLAWMLVMFTVNHTRNQFNIDGFNNAQQ